MIRSRSQQTRRAKLPVNRVKSMEEDTDHDVNQAEELGDTHTFIQPLSGRGSSIDSTSALAHRPEVNIRC